MSYLNYYRCVKCNRNFNLFANVLKCPDCGHLLFAEYDLYRARKELYQKNFGTEKTLWRFHSLLPPVLAANRLSLGEGTIFPRQMVKISRQNNARLFIKSEGLNPSGSIRDREMAVLFSLINLKAKNGVLISGSPNSCVSAAAYAALAGVSCTVILPNSVPLHFLGELNSYGAKVHLTKPAGKHAAEMKQQLLAENNLVGIDLDDTPFRVEGAKTLIFDLLEFFNFKLPEYIFLPLGDGLLLLGIWKGLSELLQIGWIQPPFPSIVAVESAHRAPFLRALDRLVDLDPEVHDTIAVEMNTNIVVEPELLTTITKDQNWQILALDDETIIKTRKQIAESEGILISPEGSATISAYRSLKNQLRANSNHSVVFIDPVHGSKYVQSIGFLRT